MSQWLVLTLAMVAACGVVLAITVLKQRRIGEDDDPTETPDVIEYMTMMVGVVYAIVLGLAIAGVWEARSAAEDTVRTEAQALHEVSARARAYAPPVRDRIRADVERVCDVRGEEGVAGHGRAGRAHRARRRSAARRSGRTSPTTTPATASRSSPTNPSSTRWRWPTGPATPVLTRPSSTLPSVVWFGLIIGGAITIGVIFTLQIRRSGRELLMAGLFSALIAFLLFLVWDFDAPFSRGIAAGVDPFTELFPHAL